MNVDCLSKYGGSYRSKCKVDFVAVLGYFLFIFYIVLRPSVNGHVYFISDRIVLVIKIRFHLRIWFFSVFSQPNKHSITIVNKFPESKDNG